MKTTVLMVSKNTNSFGYKQAVSASPSGEVYKSLHQAYSTDPVPAVGDTIDLTRTRYGADHFDTLPRKVVAKLIREAKAKATKTP